MRADRVALVSAALVARAALGAWAETPARSELRTALPLQLLARVLTASLRPRQEASALQAGRAAPGGLVSAVLAEVEAPVARAALPAPWERVGMEVLVAPAALVGLVLAALAATGVLAVTAAAAGRSLLLMQPPV